MPLYQPKNVATVEAFPMANGDYVVIANGLATPTPKAEFEAKYVPFVKQG